MRIVIMLFILTMCTLTQAQKATSSDIVEGGKVVLEFFKLFKSDISTAEEDRTCMKLNHTDVTIDNKGIHRLIVTLYDKNDTDLTYEVVVSSGTMESLLGLNAVTYQCEVKEAETGKILKKGDVKLEPCKEMIFKID